MVNVGDKIYFKRYGNLHTRQTVTRVTPTMVRTQSFNMKKRGDGLHVTGQSTWSSISAHTETEELKREWKEIQLKNWFASNWQKISVEDIEKLRAKYEDN